MDRMDRLTVGEFRAQIARDRNTAAAVLLETGWRVSRPVARRMGLGTEDAEDALSGMAVAVFSATAGGLRDVQPDVPLAAWLRGALMNSLKRIRRQSTRAFRSPDDRCRAEVLATIGVRREIRALRAGNARASRLTLLTRKQREAWELHLQGISTQRVGERLGIGREAARERLARAWDVLEGRSAGSRPPDLTGLSRLLDSGCGCLDPVGTRIVRLRLAGRSQTDIAVELGLTRCAVRMRLRRLRGRARAVPPGA